MADLWAKDCSCIHHTVPHWVYSDVQWHQANRETLASGCLQGFLIEDLNRLRDKRSQMERRGVREIPAEVVARALREWREAPVVTAKGSLPGLEDRVARLEHAAAELAAQHDTAEGTQRVALVDRINATQVSLAAARESAQAMRRVIDAGPREPVDVAAGLAKNPLSRADIEALRETMGRTVQEVSNG